MAWEVECPRCLRPHREVERFCRSCGLPLVHPEREEEASESRRRRRKVNPLYTEGRPVKIARAPNLVQAELIAGMLLEEGIPCMLSAGRAIMAVYAPVVGPRDVLVPESAVEAAREVLAYSAEHHRPPGDPGEAAARPG
jgi:hypothetical protein